VVTLAFTVLHPKEDQAQSLVAGMNIARDMLYHCRVSRKGRGPLCLTESPLPEGIFDTGLDLSVLAIFANCELNATGI
jgi:hypothetical protein